MQKSVRMRWRESLPARSNRRPVDSDVYVYRSRGDSPLNVGDRISVGSWGKRQNGLAGPWRAVHPLLDQCGLRLRSGAPTGGPVTTTQDVGQAENVAQGLLSSDASALHGRATVAATAGVPALLYFLFVLHYSVNVPWGVDDWSMIPVVDSALHGHLGLSVLWSQYGDRRLVVSRLVFVAFGLTDHLDEQFVMLFSALTYIGAYFVFLLIFRAYLGKRLTFLPVFVLGVVWFSLADYLNTLWSFSSRGIRSCSASLP